MDDDAITGELVLGNATTGLSNEVLDSLDDDVKNNASASFADGTRKVYSAHWRIFLAWCAEWLANKKRKWSTISVAMSTINQANVTSGHPSVRADGMVQRVLRGIRRKLHVAPDQAAPFLGEHLKAGVGAFNVKSKIGLRDVAMLSCGFFGAFRRSELVSLNRGDFALDSKGWIITLRKSKTDQEGRGHRIVIPNGQRIAPVSLLDAWLELGAISDGFVFRKLTPQGRVTNKPMKAQGVAIVVKQRAQGAGYDPQDFSGHSLRAGFLTAAGSQGASVFKMREQSRHKSLEMLGEYVRDHDAFRDHAGDGFL